MKRRPENYVTLEFLSRSSNEGFARLAAAAFAAQLLHPLPGPDQQGDAGAVHKGHAGEIQRQLCRQGLLNLLIQPPQEPLSAVVVQLT